MKELIFAANWKLNKNPSQTRTFFKEFAKSLEQKVPSLNEIKNAKILIFPPATSWEAASLETSSLREKSAWAQQLCWGAQNIYTEMKGAFTGENSMQVLSELGGQYSLVGHSERRQYFKESDDFLNLKVLNLQKANMTPVLCVGESLEERESNKTKEVLDFQIRAGLKDVVDKKLVLAYEPVWAIGTGKVANLDQVKEAHQFIKELLAELNLKEVSVLYGGSVKPENAKELIAINSVNGFLVGGASLEAESFSEIIKNGVL